MQVKTGIERKFNATTGGWSEEGPGLKMVCVSINTECHRTCLADVFAVLAPGALPEKYIANIRASLLKHLD